MLIRLRVCTGWSGPLLFANPRRQVFSRRGPYSTLGNNKLCEMVLLSRFCRGCRIECNSEDFNFGSSFIAIDWEPTALHLRYQTTNERVSFFYSANLIFVLKILSAYYIWCKYSSALQAICFYHGSKHYEP